MSTATGPVAFSSDADHWLRAHLSTSVKSERTQNIYQVYEIARCVEVIRSAEFKHVALQFPDHLLADAVTVAAVLREQSNSRVFILGDTTYGSCCVDTVAAEHMNADLIIHYGHSCLNTADCRVEVSTFIAGMPVILMYSVEYSNHADEIAQELGTTAPEVIVSRLSIPDVEEIRSKLLLDKDNAGATQSLPTEELCHEMACCSTNSNECSADGSSGCCSGTTDKRRQQYIQRNLEGQTPQNRGRIVQLPEGRDLSEYTVVYIGQESLTLTSLMFEYSKCKFVTYDPKQSTARQESLNVNRALMRRYFLVQKAKEADVVGILVGTLGIANYLSMIEYLKKLIVAAGKKYYLMVIGKININKLANFMGIDIFCIVACPENSLIDSKEFHAPIITPFELEIACVRGKEWTGDYTTDFASVLPGLASADEENGDTASSINDDDDEPEFSVLTGELRSAKGRHEVGDGTHIKDVAVRDQHDQLVLSSPAAQFLANASFKGLEVRAGETEVKVAREGAMGIAKGYTTEIVNKDNKTDS